LRRKRFVVMVMVAVLALMWNDVNMLEPFYHAPTAVTGNDETDREAVVGMETFAVGIVSNEDSKGWVHGENLFTLVVLLYLRIHLKPRC